MLLLNRNSNLTPAEKQARIYLVAAYMGAAGIVLCMAARLLAWPDFIQGFSIGILLVALLILILRRNRLDEYYRSLWSAGTSFAFAVLVLWFLFAPFAQGLVNSITSATYRDMPSNWGAPLAILGFFVGFHVQRLRSR